MKYLSLKQLLALHVLVVAAFGGADELRDLGRVKAALATQRQYLFGLALYPTVHDKAAAVCRGIIGDHPFVDGNKRTALLTAITCLEINGYKFVANQGEIEDFAVRSATERLTVPTIAIWFKNHTELA